MSNKIDYKLLKYFNDCDKQICDENFSETVGENKKLSYEYLKKLGYLEIIDTKSIEIEPHHFYGFAYWGISKSGIEAYWSHRENIRNLTLLIISVVLAVIGIVISIFK